MEVKYTAGRNTFVYELKVPLHKTAEFLLNWPQRMVSSESDSNRNLRKRLQPADQVRLWENLAAMKLKSPAVEGAAGKDMAATITTAAAPEHGIRGTGCLAERDACRSESIDVSKVECDSQPGII